MPESAQNLLHNLWNMPAGTWIKILIAVAVLVVLCVVLKKILQIGQVIFVIALFIVGGIVCAKWVRDRDEPRFMTPVIDFLASFFPSSKNNNTTQQKNAPHDF